MKYKAGDRFKRCTIRGIFDTGKIVAVMDDHYILEVSDHDDMDDFQEARIFVARNDYSLDRDYKKIEPFFEERKTYRYKFTLQDWTFYVESVLTIPNPAPHSERAALVQVTKADGKRYYDIFHQSTFDGMEEI